MKPKKRNELLDKAITRVTHCTTAPELVPLDSDSDKGRLVAIDWARDEMVAVETTGAGPEEAAFVEKHLNLGRAVRRLDTGLPVIVIRGGVAEVVYGDAHIIDLDNPED